MEASMGLVVQATSDMDWPTFLKHMKLHHPGVRPVRFNAHGNHHLLHPLLIHIHLDVVTARRRAVLMAEQNGPQRVIAADAMDAKTLLKHIELRHPWMRFAKVSEHEADHRLKGDEIKDHWHDEF